MRHVIIFGIVCIFFVCIVSAENIVCSETPDDTNIYTPSYVRYGARIYKNICQRDAFEGKTSFIPKTGLLYWQCVEGKPQQSLVNCEYDCFDGACIDGEKYAALRTQCIDYDDGIKPFKRGYTTSEYGQKLDVCVDQNNAEVVSCFGEKCFLMEHYCERNNRKILQENIKCEYGCSAGACLECNGCVNDGNCYPVGSVLDEEFCNIYYDWQRVKYPEESCVFSYECESQFCKDGLCFVDCDGCWFESQCLVANTVVKEQYCDGEKNKMVPQRYIGATCTNDFECKTGDCFENVCRPYCKNGCYTPEFDCKAIGTRFRESYCDTDHELLPLKNPGETCANDYECNESYCDTVCKRFTLWNEMLSWLKNLF